MIVRYCFNCRKLLDYRWYIKNPEFPKHIKAKIWNDKRFQLFCCGCYNGFLSKQLSVRIKNKKLEHFFKKRKESINPILKDLIRKIDPIDYRTLDWFIAGLLPVFIKIEPDKSDVFE